MAILATVGFVFSRLVIQIMAGIAGLYLSQKIFPGVSLSGSRETLLGLGATLGVFNFLFKPLLYKITFPLRLLTLGLFTWVINMGLVWAVDLLFDELTIGGILPLFLTSLLIWFLSFLFGLLD